MLRRRGQRVVTVSFVPADSQRLQPEDLRRAELYTLHVMRDANVTESMSNFCQEFGFQCGKYVSRQKKVRAAEQRPNAEDRSEELDRLAYALINVPLSSLQCSLLSRRAGLGSGGL